MLVLTRKSNQSIMIGDDIEVSVLSVMGEKVRIGISAPRDIPVFRKEVYLEIQQDRATEAAGKADVDAALTKLSSPKQGTSRATVARGRSSASAEDDVERAEHDDGDDHRRRDHREHEQGEAQRALRATALDRAHPRPSGRGVAQTVPPHAIELDLFDERPLKLGDALTHPHRSAGRLAPRAGHNAGLTRRTRPTNHASRPARRARAPAGRAAWLTLGGIVRIVAKPPRTSAAFTNSPSRRRYT